jgi:integrase
VPHLKVSGKGGKTRYVPLHPATSGLIADYLEAAAYCSSEASPLFRPLHRSRDQQSAISNQQSAISPGDHAGRGVSDGAGLFGAAGVRDWRAFAPRDGRDQCARPPGRHCKGPGMARPCEYFNDANLRSPQDQARG